MDEEESIDYQGISEAMEVLANPNRLRILRQLLEPRTVGEIDVAPERAGGPGEPATQISREGVRQHLDLLRSLGVVQRRQATRPTGKVHEYLVDQAQLFALVEGFRDLGKLRPREGWGTKTRAGTPVPGPEADEGLRLIVVRGVTEGRALPLEGSPPWLVGRSEDADVVVEFDPFVSSRNTELDVRDDGCVVRDLPRSRNGTRLNWEELDEQKPRRIDDGDVLGVGRTLLLFRT